jgi:hypothetical protein
MKSSPLNYITIITNIHIEQNMHINVSIPVTITHVKRTPKNRKKKNRGFCGHNDQLGCI